MQLQEKEKAFIFNWVASREGSFVLFGVFAFPFLRPLYLNMVAFPVNIQTQTSNPLLAGTPLSIRGARQALFWFSLLATAGWLVNGKPFILAGIPLGGLDALSMGT